MMNMPAGVRFKPQEIELVVGYLGAKNCGQPLPWGHIPDTPLYSAEPWRVLNNHHWDVVAEPDVQGGDDKMSTYIFTTLTKKKQLNLTNKASKGKKKQEVVEADDGGKRDHFVRTAGCGTWKSQNRKDVLDAQGKVVGFKRHLVYEINKKSIQNPTSLGIHDHYTMNEFSLAGVGDFKYVLCVITKSFKKRKSTSSYSFDDQEYSCVDGDITRACKRVRLDDHDRFVVAADCQDDAFAVVKSCAQSSITTEDHDVGAVITTSMVDVGCSSSGANCDPEEAGHNSMELQFVNECNTEELLRIVEVLCGNDQVEPPLVLPVDSFGGAAEYQPNSGHDPVVAADCKDNAVVDVEIVNNWAPQASISTEDDGDHEKECCDPWADYDSMELDVVNNCNPDELVMMVDELYGNVQVELPPSAAEYQTNCGHDPVVAADCKDDVVVDEQISLAEEKDHDVGAVNSTNSMVAVSCSTSSGGCDDEQESCDPWDGYESMELDVLDRCDPDLFARMVEEFCADVQVDSVGEAAQYPPPNNDHEQLMSMLSSGYPA